MSGKIVILGAGGQLARAFCRHYGERAIPVTQQEVEFRDPHFTENLEAIIQKQSACAVINAAAYTQVDRAEGEGQIEAMRANAEAPGELAAWCASKNLPLVHISTEYVFDGKGSAPWKENDAPNPLNIYGESKLAGDRAVEKSGGKFLIFRTSWVYDAEGKNFFNTMLRLFSEKEEVNVVSDQIGAPTYGPHFGAVVATALDKALLMEKFPSGVYHLAGGGEISWHGFAQAIFALARSRDSGIRCGRINPIATSEYKTPAARPLNSRLDCSKARKTFGVALPPWEEGLKECFEEKYGRPGLQNRRA